MYIFKISTVWDSCISACHCVQKKSISFHGFLTLFLYDSRQSLYRINKNVGVCIFIWWKVLLWSGSLIYVTVVFSTEILPIITVVIDRQFRAKDILVLFQVWSELLCEKKKNQIKLCAAAVPLFERWFKKHNSVFCNSVI